MQIFVNSYSSYELRLKKKVNDLFSQGSLQRFLWSGAWVVADTTLAVAFIPGDMKALFPGTQGDPDCARKSGAAESGREKLSVVQAHAETQTTSPACIVSPLTQPADCC